MERNGRYDLITYILFIVNLLFHLGKYVGNRPVKLKKADDAAIRPVEIGHRKAKKLEQDLKKNRHKPYWTLLFPCMFHCMCRSGQLLTLPSWVRCYDGRGVSIWSVASSLPWSRKVLLVTVSVLQHCHVREIHVGATLWVWKQAHILTTLGMIYASTKVSTPCLFHYQMHMCM